MLYIICPKQASAALLILAFLCFSLQSYHIDGFLLLYCSANRGKNKENFQTDRITFYLKLNSFIQLELHESLVKQINLIQ